MPDLWFRSPDRDARGQISSLLGRRCSARASASSRTSFVGADLIRQGNVERHRDHDAKVVKDAMRAYRYATDGVQTEG